MKRLLLTTLAAILFVFLLAPAVASAQLPGEEWWRDGRPRPEWFDLERVQTTADQGWFDVYKLRPNVYAIFEPAQWQEVMSYLFIGTDKAMLLDTGMNIGDMKQVTDALTDKPVFVVNSHSDFDHVGCNWQYNEVWAFDDAEGYARYNAEHGITNAEALEWELVAPWTMWPAEGGGKDLPEHFSYDTYCIPPYTITHWVKEGDVIDLGNMRFEVYSTPGHSTDSISLLDRKHGLLAVGDVWYNSWLFCNDLKAYTATAVKLAELSKAADYVLPQHNVTMVSAQWMVKMDHAFRAINKGTAKQYVDDVYPDNPEWNTRYYEFRYFGVMVAWSELGLL
jgi:glyoxylase-like metal-dependent hydrolase (beta-lactamase superfamily II)